MSGGVDGLLGTRVKHEICLASVNILAVGRCS